MTQTVMVRGRLVGDRVSLEPTDGDGRRLRSSLRSLGVRAATLGPSRLDVDLAHASGLTSTEVDGYELLWDGDSLSRLQRVGTTVRGHQAALARFREILRAGPREARRAISDGAFVELLDDHQAVDVALMTMPGGFGACIFDEQGTGKTVVVIQAFDLLSAHGEADLLVVVAPKSMLAEWERDFRRFTGDVYQVALVAGDNKARATAMTSGANVLVMGFETVERVQTMMAGLMRGSSVRAVLAVDESYHVKNVDARRTRAVAEIRPWFDRAFVLCGTPAPNRPTDVMAQFDLLDYGATFRGVAIPADSAAARTQVQAAITARGIYTRNLKADVLPDLPRKTMTRTLIPFEPIQQQAYEAALDSLIVDLRGEDARGFVRRLASYFARRAALLQICSFPASVVPEYLETPAKLAALDRILDELVGKRREKVVVWSFYQASVEAVSRRYEKYGTVKFDGTVSSIQARREAVRRFQDDDETFVFVGNPAAAGAGLTLHRAAIAIYESLPNQAAHFLQSVDRIHRRGQTRDVEVVVLLCRGSIEELEYERLLRKQSAQRELLGDAGDPSATREAMLEELLAAKQLLSERLS